MSLTPLQLRASLCFFTHNRLKRQKHTLASHSTGQQAKSQQLNSGNRYLHEYFMQRGHRYLASSSPHVSHLKEAESGSWGRGCHAGPWRGTNGLQRESPTAGMHSTALREHLHTLPTLTQRCRDALWNAKPGQLRSWTHSKAASVRALQPAPPQRLCSYTFHTAHRYFSQGLTFTLPPECHSPCPLRDRNTMQEFGQQRTPQAGTPQTRSTADSRQPSAPPRPSGAAPPGGVARRRPLLAGRNAAPRSPSATRQFSVHRKTKPETDSPLCCTPAPREGKLTPLPETTPRLQTRPARTRNEPPHVARGRSTHTEERGPQPLSSAAPLSADPGGGVTRTGPRAAEHPAGRHPAPRPRPHLCRAIFRPQAARCELSPPPCPAMAAPHRPPALPDAALSGRARPWRFLGGGAPWRQTALPPALRSPAPSRAAVPPPLSNPPGEPRFPCALVAGF